LKSIVHTPCRLAGSSIVVWYFPEGTREVQRVVLADAEVAVSARASVGTMTAIQRLNIDTP
jgi:hypothetical protein